MFRFQRAKILPLFLSKRMTVKEFAAMAKVSHNTAVKAVNGDSISANIVDKICAALEINAIDYLVDERSSPQAPQDLLQARF